jgi:Spy/CpxP family protein refolding chaperone
MNQRGGPFARLNLTEQQRTDIRRHEGQSRGDGQGRERVARRPAPAARGAVCRYSDQAQVAALSARLSQVQGNLQTARIQTQEQIAKILTPDQRKLVRERGAGPMMGRMARMGRMGRMMR